MVKYKGAGGAPSDNLYLSGLPSAGKHPTILEDNVFIGSNSSLVAPIRVGQGAYIGAGSTLTKDVPGDALGVARGRQRNIEGWVPRFRKK